MKAKKFIESRQEGEYEIKTLHVLDVTEIKDEDILSIIDTLELYNLDGEDAIFEYGICFDYDGEVYSIDVNKFIKGIESSIEDNVDNNYWNLEKEQCDEFLVVLKKLEKYKGYDIYL